MNALWRPLSRSLLFLCFATLTLTVPFRASATLVGDSVFGTLNIGGSPVNFFDIGSLGSSPVPAVVMDPGVEFLSDPAAGLMYSANFGPSSLSISVTNPFVFGIPLPTSFFLFGDLDWVGTPGMITDVTLSSGTAPTFIVSGPDTISIGYLAGTLLGPGATLISHFDITAIHVPEPSTYLLLGTMVICCFFAQRHRKQRMKANK